MSRTLERPVLLQERLRNHSVLAGLTSGGLCTMRLLTYRPPGSAVQLLLGVYRMPVGNAAADNFSQGGLAAPIDLATGRLGKAATRSGKLIEAVERHPNTGAVIEGHQIPFWNEAVRLVTRAHEAASRMVVVGWDVAVLEDGVVLVEGNREPSSRISQAASGVPLGETPLVACLNAHLRESVAP